MEIVAVVAILSLLLLISLSNNRGQSLSLQAESVAQEVALQLMNKRSQALKSGQAQGLAFPGQDAFAAQAYYEVGGMGTLRMQKMRDWSNEFPRAYLSWGASGDEVGAEPAEDGDFSAFSGIPAEDPVILFLPDGKAIARGLATDGSFYYIRVGVEPQGHAGGLKSTRLEGLLKAWTISVSEEGTVLPEVDSDFPPSSNISEPSLADLPRPPADQGLQPVVESLTTSPELFKYPDGTLRLLGPVNRVQLKVRARSPEGEVLSVRWESDGGQFSHESRWRPMSYSAEEDMWTASTLWTTPPESSDTEHEITAQVRDSRGLSASRNSRNSITIDVVPDKTGLICQERVYPPDFGFGFTFNASSWIEAVKADGTLARRLTEPSQSPHYRSFLSPNGQHVALYSNQGIEIVNLRGEEVAAARNLYREGPIGADGQSTAFYYMLRWNETGTAVLAWQDSLTPNRNGLVGSQIVEIPISGEMRTLFPLTFIHEPYVTDQLEPKVIDPTLNLVFSETTDRTISFGDNHHLEVFDRRTGESRILKSGPGANTWFNTVSPLGNWIETFTWPNFGDRELINVETGETRVFLRADDSSVGGLGLGHVEFRPDEGAIKYQLQLPSETEPGIGSLSAQAKFSLKVFDLNGQQLYAKDEIISSKFSPDSRFLFVSLPDGEVLRVDQTTFREETMQVKGSKIRNILLVTNNME